ncbi:MAG TPA: iron-sulfur cluster carrier protein ApbC [Steroidobacteraceae bacterium]|nr:iron-sulfur cluster carrier protein ApbC [Steroidobacteraceae bacterium]
MNDLALSIQHAVHEFVEPCSGVALSDSGARVTVEAVQNDVTVEVVVLYPLQQAADSVAVALTQMLNTRFDAAKVNVTVTQHIESSTLHGNLKPIQGIKNILVVASGKGGVGKSTTAANLALALAQDGAAVGLLDADIYGPSQARMMGLSGQRPTTRDGKTFEPLEAHGLKVMSIGLLVDEEQPMVWRGPMVTQALTQLLNDCRWGALDYLVVDMPPGTGDIQLTLSQRVPISGAIIVTTPQDIALLDARKGLKMFQKVDVPVLGIVENMSTHICSHCGHEEHIFGAGGGARMAEQYHVDLLASLPLDIHIREQADGGTPTVIADRTGTLAQHYLSMARRASARLARHTAQAATSIPDIIVEDT